MDSSSDASFAWTDASSDTIDSVSTVNEKMGKTYSEDESVSGKSYKKKLQDELFDQSKQVLEDEGRPVAQPKRKWSGHCSESDDVKSPKKKKIKREPESDIDVSTVKNKKNGFNHSESHDSYDESYLNLKVKDEQHFVPPHPTKAKRKREKSLSNSDILRESSESTHTKHKNKSKNKMISDNDNQFEENTLNELVHEESEYNERIIKKKKKSKKRKDSAVFDDGNPINSDVEGSEACVTLGTPSSQARLLASLPSTGYAAKNNGTKREEKETNEVTSTNKTNSNTNYSEKRITRISERIQFEDESSDLETSQFKIKTSSKKFNKLKQYSLENLLLKPLTSTPENTQAALTADDEVWLIRCPKDVHVDAFQDKHLTLQGKCKLKLNGLTYEGTVDDEPGNTAILSLEQSHFVIKSLSVKGFLNLRKRIPKTHIQDDIALNNNQANFIPLPETKSRHPLFGYNYKKSIKLAASVTERLHTSTPSQYKKYKPYKEKSLTYEQDNDQFPVTRPKEECSTGLACADVSAELSEQAGSRKKNKHKKNRGQDLAPKKKNKSKHDLESVEVWDSEKAIEENLFNF